MSTHRVIFTPDDYWTNPPEENTMTDRDDHTDRIRNTPFHRVPDDTVHVISPIQLMIGAAPDGQGLTAGLLFDAPAPLGAVQYMLTGPQVAHLYEMLHDFIHLTDNELTVLKDRLHGDEGA